MYLKNIEVNGFKSFANKINFQFNNGITCIVGPNGSGKSNVADAVRWVLGEQSAKSLRGSKMEDVIFSGTELRKPQGSAYVAITLDNSDHSLPIDYNEVTVARRVYRSGESEYLINGVASRLKDVTSLFFDTGIGKEGYSIIGQGQIEKILNGKPEERRELFDEAAGIVKLKKNKAAAEKSLEAERDNLSRVNDILNELERQVGPLKEQSEVARKYLQYKEELKQLDVNAFLLELDELKDSLTKDTENLQIINDDIASTKELYEQTREEYDRIEHELEQINNLIEQTRNKTHDISLVRERKEGEINVINQQIVTLKLNDKNIHDHIDRINSQIEAGRKELQEYYNKKTALDEELDGADDSLEQAKEAAAGISETIEKLENEIEDCKANIIEYINESGTLKAKVGRYDAMLENIYLRRTQLNQRYLQFKSDDTTDRKEYEKLNSELKELESNVDGLLTTLEASEKELEENQSRNKHNREIIHNTNEELSAKKSKLEALRNITERYDGYGNSIRRVMEQKASNPGIIGVVADIITVDKRYEVAVETALGGSIQNIVTEDDATAKKMISYLKTAKAGRATFLPLNNILDRSNVRSDVLSEKGVIGLASDLVEYNPKYKNLIGYLLGRIVVTNNIDNAILVSRKYNQSLRLVTVEGELISPGGSMTGGAFKNSSNLLGRKRELDELKQQINDLNKTALSASKLDEELKHRRDELKQLIDEYNTSLQQAYLRKNTLTMNIEQVSAKLSESANAFSSIQKELAELNNQITEINGNKDQLYSSNKAHEEAKVSCEDRIKDLESEIATKKQDLVLANEKVSDMMLEFNTVKQRDDFILENIRRIKQDEKLHLTELERYKNQVQDSYQEITELNNNIAALRAEIDAGAADLEKLNTDIETFTENRNRMNASHKEFFDRREELSEKISGLEKASYKLSGAIEKNTEKSDDLTNYMWEEYEMTYSTALNLKSDDGMTLAALKKEITAAKGRIKALGDVNVNSIEDYKEISERYEFLKTQHDDIVAAENNLLGVIHELETSMKEQFAEKFKDIQFMFDKVFKELFGGGRGSLELVDDDDLLETGIRIIAQPPGKKLQNMMQLSGGEKSLTAISLLFAIQSLKPSPFCLLDEIEAALDDSNVKRFARYLSRLTKDTQFIVISHRKGTMEAADILYGITMQEKGVSTLVSVNLIENDLDK